MGVAHLLLRHGDNATTPSHLVASRRARGGVRGHRSIALRRGALGVLLAHAMGALTHVPESNPDRDVEFLGIVRVSLGWWLASCPRDNIGSWASPDGAMSCSPEAFCCSRPCVRGLLKGLTRAETPHLTRFSAVFPGLINTKERVVHKMHPGAPHPLPTLGLRLYIWPRHCFIHFKNHSHEQV